MFYFQAFWSQLHNFFKVDISLSHGAVQAVNSLISAHRIFGRFGGFLRITFKFFLLACSFVNTHTSRIYLFPLSDESVRSQQDPFKDAQAQP